MQLYKTDSAMIMLSSRKVWQCNALFGRCADVHQGERKVYIVQKCGGENIVVQDGQCYASVKKQKKKRCVQYDNNAMHSLAEVHQGEM